MNRQAGADGARRKPATTGCEGSPRILGGSSGAALVMIAVRKEPAPAEVAPVIMSAYGLTDCASRLRQQCGCYRFSEETSVPGQIPSAADDQEFVEFGGAVCPHHVGGILQRDAGLEVAAVG